MHLLWLMLCEFTPQFRPARSFDHHIFRPLNSSEAR